RTNGPRPSRVRVRELACTPSPPPPSPSPFRRRPSLSNVGRQDQSRVPEPCAQGRGPLWPLRSVTYPGGSRNMSQKCRRLPKQRKPAPPADLAEWPVQNWLSPSGRRSDFPSANKTGPGGRLRRPPVSWRAYGWSEADSWASRRWPQSAWQSHEPRRFAAIRYPETPARRLVPKGGDRRRREPVVRGCARDFRSAPQSLPRWHGVSTPLRSPVRFSVFFCSASQRCAKSRASRLAERGP